MTIIAALVGFAFGYWQAMRRGQVGLDRLHRAGVFAIILATLTLLAMIFLTRF